jgi:hypothetical protein
MKEIALTIDESVLNVHFNIMAWLIINIIKCIKINYDIHLTISLH